MRIDGGSATPNPRSVVLLHRGGAFVRGTEAVLIRSAKAFAAAGFRLIVGRRNDCIDGALGSITPRPEFVDFRFPELMIGGFGHTHLPIRSYLREFSQLRTLVARHDAALIYCSGGLPCQLAVPVARLAKVPVLCHFHHPAIRRAHYLWLARFADQRVFPSAFVQRHSPSDPRHPGTVVYNGIDLMRFQPAVVRDEQWRRRWGIAGDAIVIGQVGALASNKRPEFLVSALSSVLKAGERRLHLCLVGAGPMDETLRRLVAELGIAGNVTLTGYVDDVLPYYQHVFDINVLASSEEGLGISVIEGSACGLPAVVSNCTGLPETVIDGQTGFLFEVEDVEGLRRQLLRLAESASLRASMGLAGRALTEERFSIAVYDEKLMGVAADLLRRTGQDA